MLIAVSRNALIVVMTIVIVAISAAFWPIEDLRPERQLANAGARLAFAHDETMLVGVSLDGAQFGDDQVQIAADVPTLQRLSLADSIVTRRGIQALQVAPGLKFLNLARTRWTFEALDDISRLSNLQELNLEGCEWLGDDQLLPLASLPKLELLNVSATSITPAGIEQLCSFPALKYVVLIQCPHVNDAAIDSLIALGQSKERFAFNLSWTEISSEGLQRLRSNLPQCSIQLRPESMIELRDLADRGQFLTDAAGEIVGFRRGMDPYGIVPPLQPGDMPIISSIPGMTRLNLDQTHLTDSLLLELGPMPRLEVLRLTTTRVTDAGLQVLDRMPKLTTLQVTDSDIEGSGLMYLRHVPKLQILQIQSRQGNEVLPQICELGNLRTLSIEAPLTDAGIEQLEKLPCLRTLELIHTHVRSAGLSKLADFRELSDLMLEGGDLDDSDIETLGTLKHLKRITLMQTRVTLGGRTKLMSMAPNTSVTWSDQNSQRTEYRDTSLAHRQQSRRRMQPSDGRGRD